MHPKRIAVLEDRARSLRVCLTPSEQTLWRCLRQKPFGIAFKKQVRVGGFIADFLAPRPRVIVEVDGPSHRGRERADERRDRKLRRLGYRVLRLDAELVLRDLPAALARICQTLRESP
jgi:very-short-patch-repair endonuclease